MTAIYGESWDRGQRLAGRVGAACLAVWLAGTLAWPQAGFRAYWFAFVFWSGLGLGSLLLCFLQFVTRGDWGLAVQRPLEAALMTLPLLCVLFLPVLAGMRHVFPWTAVDLLANAPHKRSYLTTPWFAARTLIFFGLLIPLALRLRAWSAREDEGRMLPEPATRMRVLSSGGLVVYCIGMLLISTDWIMSLEPRWHSTMFVVIIGIGQLLTALAASVAFILLAPARFGYTMLSDTKLRRDLGNLLMTFVVFWTYVSFSQFLIIWSGNLPAEISWYLHRSTPGWQAVAALLALLQFALPFALLLSRATKARPRLLASVAVLVVVMNMLNVFWLVVPSFGPCDWVLPGLCLPALAGMGGLWVMTWLAAFKRRPPIPRLALEQGKEAAHG
ncbi:MAG: hypothetical protein JWO94_998 [Verrucomicrobiaceae bacterium]|nr:hypothetical protein [Verrucomicrobiaceae bacterium]